MTKRRSALVWALLVLSTLILLVASMTVWSKRQLLDTDNFTDSSGKLLANDEIRTALSARLVDLLDQRVDFQSQLRERLPENVQAAAPIAAATIRNAAGRVIDAFLATAQAQELWERVVRRSHTALVNVLEGKDAGPISTANGDVVLDLRPFLQRIAERLGVEDRLQERAAASPTSGEIVILKSDQLDAAQATVRILKALSSLLVLVVLALFALAVYLAHGRRRETLMRVGWCLLFVGLILGVIRRVVGGAVIDSLVEVEASKPAVNAVWLIETDLLRDLALALIVYGLAVVVAGFVAGPSPRAVSLRLWMAPTFRERPAVVWIVALFAFLLVMAWGPTGGSRRLLGVVILAALLALGIELWRRQTLREFPEGVAPASGGAAPAG
jgi:hypothetical protein